jgi:hypothetical protein
MVILNVDDNDGLSTFVALQLKNQSPLIIQPKRVLMTALSFKLLEPITADRADIAFINALAEETDCFAVCPDDLRTEPMSERGIHSESFELRVCELQAHAVTLLTVEQLSIGAYNLWGYSETTILESVKMVH